MILPTSFAITEPALRSLLEQQASAHELRASFDSDGYEEALYDVEDGVASVPVHGTLFRGAGNFWAWFFGGSSYDTIAEQITHASQDGRVQAIVLDVSSPGGTVEGLSTVVEAIEACDKPVIAHASGQMCSAAYWLASAADLITADEPAAVGCLGCLVTVPNGGSQYSTNFVSSLTPNKNATPTSTAGAAQYQQLADDHGETMLNQIAAFRGETAGKAFAERYGAGAVLAAPAALERGMVDALTSQPGRLARAMSGLAGPNNQELTLMAKDLKLITAMLAATGTAEAPEPEAMDDNPETSTPDNSEGDDAGEGDEGEESVDELKNRIASLEEENASLRQQLEEATADDEEAQMEAAARAAGPAGMKIFASWKAERAKRAKAERTAAVRAQKSFSAAALAEGKISPKGRDALERAFAAAPDAITEFMDSLPQGCVVDLTRRGEGPSRAPGKIAMTEAVATEHIKAIARAEGLSYGEARTKWIANNPEAAKSAGLAT